MFDDDQSLSGTRISVGIKMITKLWLKSTCTSFKELTISISKRIPGAWVSRRLKIPAIHIYSCFHFNHKKHTKGPLTGLRASPTMGQLSGKRFYDIIHKQPICVSCELRYRETNHWSQSDYSWSPLIDNPHSLVMNKMMNRTWKCEEQWWEKTCIITGTIW